MPLSADHIAWDLAILKRNIERVLNDETYDRQIALEKALENIISILTKIEKRGIAQQFSVSVTKQNVCDCLSAETEINECDCHIIPMEYHTELTFAMISALSSIVEGLASKRSRSPIESELLERLCELYGIG